VKILFISLLVMLTVCNVLLAAEAGRILESEAHLVDLPQPLPTLEELDERRSVMKLSRQ